MQKTAAAADLGKRFGAVFNEVTEDHVPYVVTRDQQPEAVLVPYAEFQCLLKDSDSEVLRRFEVRARIRERTAGFSEEEVAADVAAARAEQQQDLVEIVRSRQRDRRREALAARVE